VNAAQGVTDASLWLFGTHSTKKTSASQVSTHLLRDGRSGAAQPPPRDESARQDYTEMWRALILAWRPAR
jgi:hypothetical protein